MSDDPDLLNEVAAAHQALGHTVQPWGEDLELWLVDGKTLTDGELVALAYRLGLMDGPDRTQ